MTEEQPAGPPGSGPTRPGPSRAAITVLVVLIVAFVLGLAAVVGYVLLGRSDSGGSFPGIDTPSSVATTVPTADDPDTTPPATTTTPGLSSSSSSPSSSRRAPTTTAAGAPQDSTPCPIRYPRTGLYRASSVGSSVTSCGFAENVRIAYARSGRPGQLPRPITAISPETGSAVTVMCAAEGPTVTCTGGDDAVVYLY